MAAEPINWRESWPWHLASWVSLALGLLVRDGASTGPSASPFWDLGGFVMVTLGILGLAAVALWEFSQWVVRR